MKRIKKAFLALQMLAICLMACSQQQKQSLVNPFEKYANDSLRFDIYKNALNNTSTSPSHIVIKVTNRSTGEQKELCTEAPFLEGALHEEYGIDYDSIGMNKIHNMAIQQVDRSFKFSSAAALDNVGFGEYPSIKEVKAYAMALDIDYYKQIYGSNQGNAGINFQGRRKAQLLFAHVLFQCGIISRRTDLDGNILVIGNPGLNEEDSLHFRIGIPRPNLN